MPSHCPFLPSSAVVNYDLSIWHRLLSGENHLGARRNLAPRNSLLSSPLKKKAIVNCFKINIHLLTRICCWNMFWLRSKIIGLLYSIVSRGPALHRKKNHIKFLSIPKKVSIRGTWAPWCLWAGSTFVPLSPTWLMAKGGFLPIKIGLWNWERPIW